MTRSNRSVFLVGTLIIVAAYLIQMDPEPEANSTAGSVAQGQAELPECIEPLAATPFDQTPWQLVWNDEFSGEGRVNEAEWMYALGSGYPGGIEFWGTGEIEVMTDQLRNVYQSCGYLGIRAVHEGATPESGWTSGRIETLRTDFQPEPGEVLAVEASIRLPQLKGRAAQGYWPAFWLLGDVYRGNYWNWPSIGEIDIMENVNGFNQWWGTFHCGVNPGGPCNEPIGISATESGFTPSLQDAYHRYRVEIDRSELPEEIRWYVNGVQKHQIDSSQFDPITWNTAVNHGFFIILNLAIGGGAAGLPTSATQSGGEMRVDYVRVYLRQ